MSGLVCNSTTEDQTITEIPLWTNGYTFHHLCLFIGGAFTVFAWVISFVLILSHATHYSRPVEQRHIIRIVLMIPIYSSVSWLSIYYYKVSVYFNIVGYCYEAFAISSFFTLLCQYIGPDLHSQKEYFRTITPKQWIWPLPWLQKCSGGEQGIWRTPRSGLTWFNVIWFGVFQYCLLRVLMTTIAVIAQHFDVYCEETLNPAFAYVWILAIDWIAVCVAMYCLVQFYVQIKETISHYSPFLKLLSIKIVIFLSFWQSSVISVLTSIGLITTSNKVQSPDLTVGLPDLLICIEMAFVSILHLWAYSWYIYTIPEASDLYGGAKQPIYHGGRWGMKAVVDSINPLDLVQAVSRGIRWMFVGRKTRMVDDPSYYPDTIALNSTHGGAVPGVGATEATIGRRAAGPGDGRYGGARFGEEGKGFADRNSGSHSIGEFEDHHHDQDRMDELDARPTAHEFV
ncbi:DUF300-domain-containing protein [Aspergillus ellipticus CBS 707.79]|uniref:DUF300-domain-containing protein n=1 Tax=Aspergillus ellipticus CBS 707.79 TaxID=1448320 RepID=A0A319E3R4_9EURO|nr:DUF300-domain-containing protein [Aspergillus ellipticus CBS 707.79]